jgi:chemotaxis regulatin CheY-phosphate phosphatase CheZ
MTDKNLHSPLDHTESAKETPAVSKDSPDTLCIMDRIQSLQSFSESLSEQMQEPGLKAIEHIHTELATITHDIQQSFENLMQVISRLHVGRSQWETKTGLIQQTGDQLHKVTQTTENATQQILDAVEKVIASQANNSQQILELLAVMEEDADSLSPEILIKTLKQLASDIETEQTDTFQIMDYLQFQDITAQQIEQAYQLLGEAEKKLVSVMQTFKLYDLKDLEENPIVAKMHDPNAEYSSAEEKQKQIDALFDK